MNTYKIKGCSYTPTPNSSTVKEGIAIIDTIKNQYIIIDKHLNKVDTAYNVKWLDSTIGCVIFNLK